MADITIQPDVPRGWFTAVGIVQILLGAVLALLMVASVAMSSMVQAQGPSGHRWFSLLVTMITYGGLAALFIACGAGILKPRRWAHRLMNIVSWLWLASDAIGFVVMTLFLPGMLRGNFAEQGLPESTAGTVLTVVFVVFSILCLAVPGLVALFYSLRSVRRTVDSLDPKPSWTDACPPSVLGLAGLYALGALMSLAAFPIGAFPLFGLVISGFPASVLILASAGFSAWLAYGCYRLRPAAFWSSAASTVLMSASAVATFISSGLERFYAAAGYGPEQADMMRQFGLGAPAISWTVVVSALGFLAYLWFVRKHFLDNTEIGKQP